MQDSLFKQRLAGLDHEVKTHRLSTCTLSKYCHLTDNTTQRTEDIQGSYVWQIQILFRFISSTDVLWGFKSGHWLKDRQRLVARPLQRCLGCQLQVVVLQKDALPLPN